MALLTVEDLTKSGLDATENTASSSDTFANNGSVVVKVTNGGGSPDTVAFVTPATTDGLAIADAGGSVPAGEARWFGTFRRDLFNTIGIVTMTHSFTTSVTVELVDVSK